MAGEAFLAASAIVSFLSGLVALAMPCCFSVLLPSYLASSFKRRTSVFGMTLVFAIGISAILLPIALGVSAVSAYINLNHSLLFVIGGFFMLFLGAASLLGLQLMPMVHPDINLQKTGVTTVFALGLFSGVASSCCAPVLAGILVLTALTGSLFGAAVVGTAYVAGMVFPLMLVSAFMDRNGLVQKMLQGRMVDTGLGSIHSSRLIAAAIFLAMGAVTVSLGLLNRMFLTPGSGIFNIYESRIQEAVEYAISSPVVQVATLAAGVVAAGLMIRRIVVRRAVTGVHEG